jgi:hypothetical protein
VEWRERQQGKNQACHDPKRRRDRIVAGLRLVIHRALAKAASAEIAGFGRGREPRSSPILEKFSNKLAI